MHCKVYRHDLHTLNNSTEDSRYSSTRGGTELGNGGKISCVSELLTCGLVPALVKTLAASSSYRICSSARKRENWCERSGGFARQGKIKVW